MRAGIWSNRNSHLLLMENDKALLKSLAVPYKVKYALTVIDCLRAPQIHMLKPNLQHDDNWR